MFVSGLGKLALSVDEPDDTAVTMFNVKNKTGLHSSTSTLDTCVSCLLC